MVQNKPTYRMQKIGHSHHRSEQIEDNMVKNVDDRTWLVKSATLGRGLYTVPLDDTFDCNNCPLSCPICRVCVHQFTCTCVDHQIKGNFCKHVHACVRVSKSDFSLPRNEEDVTTRFEGHNEKVIEALQEQPVHINDSVSLLTRIETLLSITFGIVNTATEQTLSEILSPLEKIVEKVKQDQISQETVLSSIPHFSDLPSNLPSHKNLGKQRDNFNPQKKSQYRLKTDSKNRPTWKKFQFRILSTILQDVQRFTLNSITVTMLTRQNLRYQKKKRTR